MQIVLLLVLLNKFPNIRPAGYGCFQFLSNISHLPFYTFSRLFRRYITWYFTASLKCFTYKFLDTTATALPIVFHGFSDLVCHTYVVQQDTQSVLMSELMFSCIRIIFACWALIKKLCVSCWTVYILLTSHFQSRFEVRNEWRYASTPPKYLHGVDMDFAFRFC